MSWCKLLVTIRNINQVLSTYKRRNCQVEVSARRSTYPLALAAGTLPLPASIYWYWLSISIYWRLRFRWNGKSFRFRSIDISRAHGRNLREKLGPGTAQMLNNLSENDLFGPKFYTCMASITYDCWEMLFSKHMSKLQSLVQTLRFVFTFKQEGVNKPSLT